MKEFIKLENIHVVEWHELNMFYTSDIGKDKVIIARYTASGMQRSLFEQLDMNLISYHILVPKKYGDKEYNHKHKYHYEYVMSNYDKVLAFVKSLNKKICESK